MFSSSSPQVLILEAYRGLQLLSPQLSLLDGSMASPLTGRNRPGHQEVSEGAKALLGRKSLAEDSLAAARSVRPSGGCGWLG